jgi:uncharacterized repeat protein (TIGR03803 family)
MKRRSRAESRAERVKAWLQAEKVGVVRRRRIIESGKMALGLHRVPGCCCSPGRLPQWAQRRPIPTVIHTFGVFPNGANPDEMLIRDTSGKLYGTTYQGGTANSGAVFKLDKSGCTVLYISRVGWMEPTRSRRDAGF